MACGKAEHEHENIVQSKTLLRTKFFVQQLAPAAACSGGAVACAFCVRRPFQKQINQGVTRSRYVRSGETEEKYCVYTTEAAVSKQMSKQKPALAANLMGVDSLLSIALNKDSGAIFS